MIILIVLKPDIAVKIPWNLYYIRTFVDNTIVELSDVVEAAPVGAAPTISSFSTSLDWAKTTARRDEKHCFGIWCALYHRFDGTPIHGYWCLGNASSLGIINHCMCYAENKTKQKQNRSPSSTRNVLKCMRKQPIRVHVSLTHPPAGKVAAIPQTTLSDIFSWMKKICILI